MSRTQRSNEQTGIATTRSVAAGKPSCTTQTAAPRQGECATACQQVAVSHQQVAERARAIWQARGCQPGQDTQNWFEAEAQLRAEAARAARRM